MPPIITILLFIALVWVSIALGKKREECRRLRASLIVEESLVMLMMNTSAEENRKSKKIIKK